jgi:hypothetical protein
MKKKNRGVRNDNLAVKVVHVFGEMPTVYVIRHYRTEAEEVIFESEVSETFTREEIERLLKLHGFTV